MHVLMDGWMIDEYVGGWIDGLIDAWMNKSFQT
jgi:hypothetical protein